MAARSGFGLVALALVACGGVSGDPGFTGSSAGSVAVAGGAPAGAAGTSEVSESGKAGAESSMGGARGGAGGGNGGSAGGHSKAGATGFGGNAGAGGAGSAGGAASSAGAGGAPAPCNCSSGECCDGCYLRAKGYPLGNNIYETACVGNDLQITWRDEYCDPSAPQGVVWGSADSGYSYVGPPVPCAFKEGDPSPYASGSTCTVRIGGGLTTAWCTNPPQP